MKIVFLILLDRITGRIIHLPEDVSQRNYKHFISFFIFNQNLITFCHLARSNFIQYYNYIHLSINPLLAID